jgi:hypothetical protein
MEWKTESTNHHFSNLNFLGKICNDCIWLEPKSKSNLKRYSNVLSKEAQMMMAVGVMQSRAIKLRT